MKKTSFHFDWNVSKGVEDPFAAIFHPCAQGEPVTLPHDAMIREERSPEAKSGCQYGFYPGGAYTYQKTFYVPTQWKGQRNLLEFEGIQGRAMVYLNGEFLKSHACGYTPFFVELDPFLRFGEENTLKVIAVTEEKASRWYPGSGIYRDVWLWQGGKITFLPEKQRITTVSAEADYALLRLTGILHSDAGQAKKLLLKVEIRDADGNRAAGTEYTLALPAGGNSPWHTQLTVDRPKLWSVDAPNLYQCVCSLYDGEMLLDEWADSFGIRTISLDARRGLRINGQPIKLRGACIHHDNGILGAASCPDAERFRVRKLKEAGFNAIRSAHNPAGKAILHACDEAGLLVMNELSDMWTEPKNSSDGAADFAAGWRGDLESMIDSSYNHPSVILYSTGNEIPEIGRTSGWIQQREIAEAIRQMDPTRFSTVGISGFLAVVDDLPLFAQAMQQGSEIASGSGSEEMNKLAGSTQQQMLDAFSVNDLLTARIEGAASAVDVVGYNYLTARHAFEHTLHPDRVVVGSETYPPEIARLWQIVRDNPHVIGDFTWTGFDYLGEAGIGVYHYDAVQNAQGWYPDRLAYLGDIDLNGTRRPMSYLREIVYGLRTEPFIAVERVDRFGKPFDENNWKYADCIDSWTFPGYENKPARVRVLADCEEVELFLNGRSLGRKPIGQEEAFTAIYELAYIPGELLAVGYRDGKETGRYSLHSAEKVTALRAVSDRQNLPADGQSLAFITVDTVDRSGIWNRWEKKTITVQVEGEAALLAFGSAAPSVEGSYQSSEWENWDGRVMAVVRSTEHEGPIRIRFTAEGCGETVVSLNC